MLAIGGSAYETWIAQVRVCTPAEAARAQPQLPGTRAERAKRKPQLSIEGRLVPTMPDCTLMECGGEVDGVYRADACCNGCSFEWVVVPRRHCPGAELSVSLRGSPSALRGGGMDCAAHGFGAEADWVIVTGRIGGQGDLVVDADLCKLSSFQNDLLSDDELGRLASPGPKRGHANDALDCPPPR